ncbi:Glycoside hydrolase family 43 [Penicillium lagena]|uniref:Glycoside hydrolase family 43 n=1 Tax=Penicillium lagena TaxID=94218 RepID=UPI0025400F11|nr:Glycoside hydrolase family 43 [Penicillium lagena]KAJ5619319.1 Glycoside hydrolase family 43 [Penicillium lagena]
MADSPKKDPAHSEVTSVSEVFDSERSSQGTFDVKSLAQPEQVKRKCLLWPPRNRRDRIILSALGVLAAVLLALVIALPIVLTRNPHAYQYNGRPQDPTYHIIENRPVFGVFDFPDPGLVHHNGTWYAYGTNPRRSDPASVHVPVATSTNFINWTLHHGYDAMPGAGGWEREINHWAPDVIQRDDGKFLLYYAGEAKHYHNHHCVGVAVSQDDDPMGPYIPEKEPLACPHKYGGAIDPSPFRDVDGKLYVTYKADGNSVGHGGYCGNSKLPLVSVPIMLQEMESNGITKIGEPEIILDIIPSDGPLVEAPNIIRREDGTYILFYSSHCYTSLWYDVKYAHARSIRGPYTRAAQPLFETGDFDLQSPGGATVSLDGTKMVFHADCDPKNRIPGPRDSEHSWRCMYAAAINIQANNTIALSSFDLMGSANSTNPPT